MSATPKPSSAKKKKKKRHLFLHYVFIKLEQRKKKAQKVVFLGSGADDSREQVDKHIHTAHAHTPSSRSPPKK